jgi:hypothetical protein
MPPRSTAPAKLPSPGKSPFLTLNFFAALLAIVFINRYAKNSPMVSAWKADLRRISTTLIGARQPYWQRGC